MEDVLTTDRLLLYPSNPCLARAVFDYFTRNRLFLQPFEPARESSFFTLSGQRRLLLQERRDAADGVGFRFWTIRKTYPRQIIGSVSLGGIVWGSFQNANVSYRSDKDLLCRGFVTEALSRLVSFAFLTLGLHRLEANIMPRNAPSLRVAEKLGFTLEGLRRAYLSINGVWEDHMHMSLINTSRTLSGKEKESPDNSLKVT